MCWPFAIALAVVGLPSAWSSGLRWAGVGLTAAAGWRQFFLLGDFNFSQTDIGFDDPFRAYIGTIRTGWNGAVLGAPIRVWIGGSYWGTKGTAKATVDVPGVGSVTFAAVQQPVHPLNALVGANATLFRRWELFGENSSRLSPVLAVAVFLIGYGVVYLGWHWLSDALGGLLLGLTLLFGLIAYLERKRTVNPGHLVTND